ncbi:MAG: tetratricopeptide repeat protein [Gammaproteobacteria bacterium]|nr:tetratricopeptide repeat protein [Gammaproteobacteria bacterium]
MSNDQVPDYIPKGRAKDLLAEGRIEEAREQLRELCHADQRDVEIWFMYSAASAHLRRFEDTVSACRKALGVQPDHLPSLNNLASALAALGRHDEAAVEFARLVQLAPDNPAVLNNYGHALALLGRADEARTAFENAIRIQPFYAEAHYNLALLLEQTGSPDAALSEYEKAANLKPGLPDIESKMRQLRKIAQS